MPLINVSGGNFAFIILLLDLSVFFFFYSAQYHRGEGVVPPWIFPLWQPDCVSPSADALQRH